MPEPVHNVASVLGTSGSIARRLPGYEPRPEQLAMAHAVEQAIATKKHLIAEAGTGVGKSFAYLVPAILAAQSEEPPAKNKKKSGDDEEDSKQGKRRIIVSTHTISLQEQLIHHDVPFLQAVLPVEFSAVLVKGRSNYISLRRLDKAVQRSGQKMMFEAPGQQALSRIRQWATQTRDGSRSDLPFQPPMDVWDEVYSDHGDCLRKKCPTHTDCFYYAARRRVWNADLLIVNHALFFSDLALRRDGASILPDYETVIFDEAHTIEAVAADHLGLSVSEGQVEFLLNKLYNDQAQRGILYSHNLVDAQKLNQEARIQSTIWFSELQAWTRTNCRPNGRLNHPVSIPNKLSPALEQLSLEIREKAEKQVSESSHVELTAAADRCQILASQLNSWATQSIERSVYWVEATGKLQQRLTLASAPIEVGGILRDELYNKIPSVIMASATLATGQKDFQFFRSRIGLTGGSEIRLGSPFNYRQQARLILATNMPDPAADPRNFEMQACERIKRHVGETHGRAFVLFTSYAMM
ncbi:MAG: ATP-dependent DNA helicase, partial [Planctomyces sp.]